MGALDALAAVAGQYRSLFAGEGVALAAAVWLQWVLLAGAGALVAFDGAGLVAWRWPKVDVARWGSAIGLGVLCGVAVLSALPALGPWPDAGLLAAVAAVTAWLGARRGWLRWMPVAVGVVALGVHWRAERWPLEEGPDLDAGGPDVVLITLDTFRADHMGAIGGFARPVATPHLDALAADGALFTHGVSPVPLTLPSHAAMHAGRAPDEVGVLRNGHALASDAVTVAQSFRAAGYRTGAFVSARVLVGQTGLDRGFEHYDDRFGAWSRATSGGVFTVAARVDLPVKRQSRRRGDLTVERALAWLDDGERPAFLWVHLYDPHSPYAAPEPWADRYDPAAPDAPGGPEDLRMPETGERRRVFPMMRPKDVRWQVAAYAGEIEWTDHLVGRLVEALRPHSIVVVAADHGESLFEHGYVLNHGGRVYEPSIRVPIVVLAPELQPSRNDAPVPLTCIAPTLRALAGLPAGGPTLFEWGDREIVSFASTQEVRPSFDFRRTYRVAFRRGDIKWIVDGRGNVERYDLAVDPGELFDQAGGFATAPAMAERGAEALARIRGLEEAVRDLGPELQEELHALGYVQ